MKYLVVVLVVVGMLVVPSQASAMNSKPPQAQSSSVWSVLKCGVAVGTFVAGNGLLITKLRKAGGVYKVARRIWRAKGAEKKWTAVVGLFGYASGIGALVEGCS